MAAQEKRVMDAAMSHYGPRDVNRAVKAGQLAVVEARSSSEMLRRPGQCLRRGNMRNASSTCSSPQSCWLLSPLLAPLAVAVRLARGPLLFRQERCGPSSGLSWS